VVQVFANLPVEREREFFTRRHDMCPALQQRLQLRRDFTQPRSRGVADDIDFGGKLRRHFYAGVSSEADDFAEVFADLLGVDVDGGH
jgi:hypothetical protein